MAAPQILVFVNVMDTIGEVEGGWDPYYSGWKKLRKFPPRPPGSLSPSLPAPVAAGLPLLLPTFHLLLLLASHLLLLLLERQVSLGIDRGSRPGSPVGRLPHLSVQTPALSETRTNKVGGGHHDKGKDRDKQRQMKTPAVSETRTNKVRRRQLVKHSQTQQGFVRHRLLFCAKYKDKDRIKGK